MLVFRIFWKLYVKTMFENQYPCALKILRVEKILKPDRALTQVITDILCCLVAREELFEAFCCLLTVLVCLSKYNLVLSSKSKEVKSDADKGNER